jgi:hypothetical protein
MTTFLTAAQREFLIEEYKEQLEEFEQLEEYGYFLDELRTYNNVDFLNQCVEFMPIYGEPAGRRILAKVKADKEVKRSDYFS